MTRITPSYRQPAKERVRRRVLEHAVRLLTARRSSALVVRPDELEAVVDYAISQLAAMGRADLGAGIRAELDEWRLFQEARVPTRTPADLRVIYLCGPEPLNDLRVLLDLGVNPHNVWAIESNERAFRNARDAVAEAGVPVKVHCGSLTHFFDQVDESFDIAYLDTTGPLLGGRPAALAPLLELLRCLRLEPLSVVVTNFAQVPSTDHDRYAQVMTDFFRYRFNDMPRPLIEAGIDPAITEHDARTMPELIKEHLECVYSDFITRLIVDLARTWVPRARGFRVVEAQYLSDRDARKTALEAAYSQGGPSGSIEEILDGIGDVHLSPSSYPLVSFLASMRAANGSEPLANQLADLQFGGRDALSLNRAVALLDKIAEGHWELASQELLEAIAHPWFDHGREFTCDIPFPNLLVNSLIGIYGQPAFASLRDSIRGRYVSKRTPMYIDVLVLDRCRYYFDWFPPAAQAPARFRSEPFQVLARCLMDRIWSSDCSPDTHPFRGSSVAGFYELESAPFHHLQSRETWD